MSGILLQATAANSTSEHTVNQHNRPNTTLTNTTLTPGHGQQMPTQDIASVPFLIIILICALVGNSLVIRAFVRFRRLRRVTNYFIVTLALSDILVASLAMPVWIAYKIGYTQIFSNIILFKLWTSTDVFSSTASIVHLGFVSLDRYLCITSPLTYHTRMTKRRAAFILVFIWVYSFFMSFLNYIVWEYHYFPLIITILSFALPLLLISLGYYKIFKAARYQAKQISLTVRGKSKKFSLSRELKAARTIGVVISAFFICWAPFFLLMVFHAYLPLKIPSLNAIVNFVKIMHYGNSMLNPIIYTLLNKEFRSAFKKIVEMKKWSSFGATSGIVSSHVDSDERERPNQQRNNNTKQHRHYSIDDGTNV